MRKFKCWLGYSLINISDWFARKHIYFDFFKNDKDNHVDFLTRWGFALWFDNYDKEEFK